MTLIDLLSITNDDTWIEIVDANTGEVYVYDTNSADFLCDSEEDDSIFDAIVMDINCYDNVLTICIEVEEEE